MKKLAILLTLAAALAACGEPCMDDQSDCCCPDQAEGVDCMPAVSECTRWMMDNCDVECVTW